MFTLLLINPTHQLQCRFFLLLMLICIRRKLVVHRLGLRYVITTWGGWSSMFYDHTCGNSIVALRSSPRLAASSHTGCGLSAWRPLGSRTARLRVRCHFICLRSISLSGKFLTEKSLDYLITIYHMAVNLLTV